MDKEKKERTKVEYNINVIYLVDAVRKALHNEYLKQNDLKLLSRYKYKRSGIPKFELEKREVVFLEVINDGKDYTLEHIRELTAFDWEEVFRLYTLLKRKNMIYTMGMDSKPISIWSNPRAVAYLYFHNWRHRCKR